MNTEQIEVNGDWPNLEGKVLDDLVCVECRYNENDVERANSIYLKCEESWYRLYFDCGIIFWRKADEGPTDYDMPEFESTFRNVLVGDIIGVNGLKICSVTVKSFDYGSEVQFVFENKQQITFFDVNDVSDYRT
ncbi:hypothetical protein [Pseudoalteromonas sp. GB56]